MTCIARNISELLPIHYLITLSESEFPEFPDFLEFN